jgi:predicted membrane metal-binding protein
LFFILLFSSVLQLILAPFQGLSLSFQLSYLALAGILTLGKRTDYRLKPWIPSFLRLPLSASLGAHIFTVPVLILHFHELYPVGLIASIAVTPLITSFMWVSLLTYMLSLLGLAQSLQNLLNRFCEILFQIITETVESFSRVPGIIFSTHSDIFIYLSLVAIIVLSLYIDLGRIHGRGKNPEFKLRFTVGNPGLTGDYGIRSQKEMEPEFSDK